MLQLNYVPETLIFNSFNWNQSQEIHVFAINDEIDEQQENYWISHIASSMDPFTASSNVSVLIYDDDFAGIQLTKESITYGESWGIAVREGGDVNLRII